MLNVYLDTATISRLAGGLDPDKLAELERLKRERKLTIYFTLHNLHELICEAGGEGHLEDCKDLLSFSGGLCSGYVLEDNRERMRRAIADFWGMSLPKLTIDWVKTVSLIPTAKSHAEIEDTIGFLRNYLEGFRQDWLECTRDTRDRLREVLGLKEMPPAGDPVLNLLSQETLPDIVKRQLWDACKLHHRLPTYANRLGHVLAYDKIPSVRYFIDVQGVYHKMILEQERAPTEADYFGIGYVIYLDLMDYFVTSDRRLKELYGSASEELGGACILLEEVSELEFLPPRAPLKDRFQEVLLAMDSR
jgi:hypothetical protein